MSVADIQRGLKIARLLPRWKVDGICGYRTLSAMRLFQEYVRSVEKLPSLPDGRFGAASQEHLQRWIDSAHRPSGRRRSRVGAPARSGETEYTAWLSLLG